MGALNDLDRKTINHECGHGVAAVLEGFSLLRIVADRHALDDNLGVCEYLADLDRPEARARVLLAGVVVEPPTTDEEARSDLAAVAALGFSSHWATRRRIEVEATFLRRAVRRATTALANAVAENGGVLNGPRAEAVVREALGA